MNRSFIHAGKGHEMPLPIDPSPADYPDQKDVVTVCAWCPGVNILRYHLDKLETLVVFVNDRKEASIYRAQSADDSSGYKRLVVSHGICEPCRAVHFPPVTTVDDGGTLLGGTPVKP
jgi:hypothetical protein